MIIRERSQMPDGTKIQIEDWKDDYPGTITTLNIAAYPKAKREGFWIRRGEPFRLDMSRGWTSDDNVREAFQALELGALSLEELKDHYWDIDKDRYLMLVESEARCERALLH